MKPGPRIDYKQLRRINPEAARHAAIECLKSNGGNIAEAARTFGINRPVVYDILRKQQEGNLWDRSKAPKHQPRKTPGEIENKVIEVKNKTRLGPKLFTLGVTQLKRRREASTMKGKDPLVR
ncbi:MAG: helix-turn-helix domain-containing protein [Chloroflexi bacterium]|nr:helix-turn-helix domain-containing protein [Chloroflexota bacterium]